MNDIYLKFPSEETAKEVLGNLQYDPESYSLDVIGLIYKATGNTVVVVDAETGDSEEEPEVKALDGYHVNLRLIQGEVPEELSEYTISKPNNPVRVWA